jgi:Kef-type K+ transport system membrane component KefB
MAVDSFPVDEAQLVALFMEAVAYGIYLVTLGMCLRALFWGSTGKKERYNWPLIIVVGLMFVFCTLDVAIGLRHTLDAFIFYKGPGGANAEFADISYWISVMKVCPSKHSCFCQ